ncbi:hypothetical protein [Mucilaginibacter sp. 10I4]|uniref:hypothetical protein n=1 Tax=Mucilaginibacter sp. 10I4 TaxID=3048580 RepID=UPI002B225489|nr:hypothetical protein [Mucilaginibacter sp. 10I4]MEB0260730.1 hypothetical protein [Mucilaginibacter sp. 10I4]
MQIVENIAVYNARMRSYRPVVADGIFLCGDATAIIDPASTQGVLSTVMSGIRAGTAFKKIIGNRGCNLSLPQVIMNGFNAKSETNVSKLTTYYNELSLNWF